MMKTIFEAILYNSYGMIMDRRILDDTNIQYSLAKIIQDDWVLSEGDMIRIQTNTTEY